MKIHNRRCTAGVTATALISAALLLGGCGGSSAPSSGGTAAQESHGSAVVSSAGGVVAAGAAGHSNSSAASKQQTDVPSRKDPVTSGGTTVQHSPPSRDSLEGQDGEPRGQNPCDLVTRGEANAIFGGAIVSKTEAPLGPTCILKLQGKRPMVTLTVERLSIAKLGSQFKGAERLAIADHQGLCGKLGRPMLFVSIGGGQVLNVTAPCAAAKALAAKAIGRIEG